MKSIGRATKILWNIVRNSIKIFIKTKSFQKVINSLFYDTNKLIIESLEHIDYVVMRDGTKYHMSRLINVVIQAQQDYIFDDIRKDDIVIDIGASVGGFCIPASKKANRLLVNQAIQGSWPGAQSSSWPEFPDRLQPDRVVGAIGGNSKGRCCAGACRFCNIDYRGERGVEDVGVSAGVLWGRVWDEG